MKKVNKIFKSLCILLLINGITSCPLPTNTENRVDLYEEANFFSFMTNPKDSTTEFQISDIEVTYGLWYQVYIWATEVHGHYTFAHSGDEGYEKAGYFPENGNLPVCGVNYRDAIVWCNAASEKANLTPVYYISGEYKNKEDFKSEYVIRDAHYSDATPGGPDVVEAGDGLAENACVNPYANGYRLPTKAEWLAALNGIKGTDRTNISTYDVTEANITDYAVCDNAPRCEEVKSKKGMYGLYDMLGNVKEWCFDDSTPYEKPVMGGDFHNTKKTVCSFVTPDIDDAECILDPVCNNFETFVKDGEPSVSGDGESDYDGYFINIPVGFRLSKNVIKK